MMKIINANRFIEVLEIAESSNRLSYKTKKKASILLEKLKEQGK